MCGRYTLSISLAELQLRFSFPAADLEHPERYNIAPTQSVLTVVNQGQEQNLGEYMRWGLVPSWAKDISIGSRMINARAETIVEKPSFRRALQKRRCLVLSDGFYEWKRTGKDKQPMYIGLESGQPFGMAGLWEAWKSPDGEWLHSCTIITTEPNALMEKIHNRMPVILPRESEPVWLDPGVDDPSRLTDLLQPYPADAMTARPVSGLVNNARNDFPECIAPLEDSRLV